MSMTIDREGNGYRIRLSGDRDKIVARTPKEIQIAVAHYYGDHAHLTEQDNCPICRVIVRKSSGRNRRTPKRS